MKLKLYFLLLLLHSLLFLYLCHLRNDKGFMSSEETDYSIPSSILFLNAVWKYRTKAQKHKGKNTLKLTRSQKCIINNAFKGGLYRKQVLYLI